MQSGRALRTASTSCFTGALLLSVFMLMCAGIAAPAAPLRIVAIGASNTHGWYVGNQGAYPAQLEALLRARGMEAHVTNAGVPFETTSMMLRRIDRDVPNGTDIVIIQPGSNDLQDTEPLDRVLGARLRDRSRSVKLRRSPSPSCPQRDCQP